MKIKIKTWVCPNCGYKQDFNPNDKELMSLHFPDVEIGHCPACFVGKNPEKTVKKHKMLEEKNNDNKILMIIKEEKDIEDEIVAIKKENTQLNTDEYRNKRKKEIKNAIKIAKNYQ